ncbi:ribosome maturation factor RimM [Castellaniella sp.]|uniref:ribosome maturation factor RimM n=1 Tax=Castellaniella sp. TaxID=1955812 RepID=UPI002AFF3361|nr:ribosome maturation factor RimM [Castellaniella sp.]
MSLHSSSGTTPDDLVEVGRVTGAHGVRGWVKIQPYSPQAEALRHAPVWWLKAPDSLSGSGALWRQDGVQVTECRFGGQFLLAQLQGTADRDAAETLRGHSVWVPRAAFPAADDDEYYWIDLLGCDVYAQAADGRSVLLGQVAQVLDNGAHAVLQVHCGEYVSPDEFQARLDAKQRPVQVLVPFVAAHVLQVDMPNRRIDSNWPIEF